MNWFIISVLCAPVCSATVTRCFNRVIRTQEFGMYTHSVGKTASSRVFKRGLKLCHAIGTIGGCSGVPWVFLPREIITVPL